MDTAEDAEVDKGDDDDDKTVETSPFRKLSGPAGYFISLCSGKKWGSFNSFGYSWGSQLKAPPKWLQAKFADIVLELLSGPRDLQVFLILF